jgi:hypothetical protein
VSYSYELEKEWLQQAKLIAKHITAILKVGQQFAMSKEDIAIALEHHGLRELPDYILRDALNLLFETDVKRTPDYLYYIREVGERKDVGFY